MRNIFSKDIVLVLISGLALIPGWYEWGTGLTLLVAFIPLLILIENNVDKPQSGRKVYLLSSLSFFVWNFGTIWWIRHALVEGEPSISAVAAAVMLSTVFMSIAFCLAFKVWKTWGRNIGLFSVVVFWLAFEYAYTHGEVAWPWLTLGNGFAYEVKLIQWYELTGALGGTLWVLLVNVLVFKYFMDRRDGLANKKLSILIALIITAPIVGSLIRYYTYSEEINPRKIVVVQPNVDPYLKFNDIPPEEQARIQIDVARERMDSTVDYVVAPETSIMNNIWLGKFNNSHELNMVREFQRDYPNMKYVTGIMCYKIYEPGAPLSSTAREYKVRGKFFDSYNSAIQIDSRDSIQIYHKSKLVTGVEKMPYPALFKILKPITMRLGGTFRSHSKQKERTVFDAPNDSLKIGTVICYESVFGEFVTEYVQKGAGLLFVITNDGWWGDTPGHRQHNSLSSIRAIETRRSIARSANTGVSSFINQRGDVLQSLSWWKRGALIGELNVNHRLTFFVMHGDYIGRAAFFLSVLMVLSLVSKYARTRVTKS